MINDGILKRETIQSSTAHVSPCQNVLSSLSAGKDTTFSHAVLSPLLLTGFLLCILVHMCNHSCFFPVMCSLLLLSRTVFELMPDSHLLFVCVFVLFMWNQLCTIIKLNWKQASAPKPAFAVR